MASEIHVTLNPNWELLLTAKCKNSHMRDKLVDGLRRMPVIIAAEKRKDQYLTFVHHIDKLRKICIESNIRLFFSEKVLEAECRYKNKINKIRAAKQNTEFSSPLWTDDEMRKVLPYQAQAINACMIAKRYLVGDDMGCISGDTNIIINCRHYSVEEAYKRINKSWDPSIERKTRSFFMEEKQFFLNKIEQIIFVGIKKTILIKAKTDRKNYEIRLTPDHLLLDKSFNWIEAEKLKIGDFIKVNGKEIKYCDICKRDTEIITWGHSLFKNKCKDCIFSPSLNKRVGFTIKGEDIYITKGIKKHPYHDTVGVPYHRLIYESYLNNKSIEEWLKIIENNEFTEQTIFLKSDQHLHHKDGDHENNELSNLELLDTSEHAIMHSKEKRNHLPFTISEDAIITDLVLDMLETNVYDIKMKGPNHNFVANGIIVHNCGKTIEAIGIICKAIEDDYKKFLIICPNRLKYQWRNEILSFTKLEEEKVVVFDSNRNFVCPLKITDTLNMRNQCCKECDRNEKCKRERYDPSVRFRSQIVNRLIAIVNFEIVDRFKDIIIGQRFNGIFIDEASRMKNIKAITTKAIISIVEEMPSDKIVVPMSGTFIENRIEEIYPSLTLVHKGLLGEYHSFQNNYLVKDYWGNVVGHRNEKCLKNIIKSWIIRRSVDEVWKDRPPLIEITEVCKMTQVQRKIYLDAREGMLAELKDKTKQNKINMADIGALLMYLIQICDSTETVDPEIKESGKLEVLKEKIENDIAQRHKVLIFSFFANKMIPIIIREMEKYGKCLSITGKVKPEKAEEIKKLFTEDKDYKFLICSDSMAYGANLQAARYVINFDLPWNPAKIDQRIRRVYRKGQKHTVTVINLVTQDTIEDLILEKLSFKRKIFETFLGSSLGGKPTLSTEDMLNILNKKPTI